MHLRTVIEATPASDVSGPPDVTLVIVRQADRQDVRLERQQRLVESQQREIVFESTGIELRMTRHDLDPPLLVAVGFVLVRQIVLADSQQ